MKILSLVPSITETLIACNAHLIGRTRFCIHPQEQVSQLPKLGGTKDIDWDKVKKYQPDLVIFDKEENTLEMANTCPFDYIALHITSVYDVGPELARLAKRIDNDRLHEIAVQWQDLTSTSITAASLSEVPGIIKWWRKPINANKFVYLIWRKPWMAIGNNTFIQSMLDFIGLSDCRIQFSEKYPTIDLSLLDAETLLLCSSEPYPFAKAQESVVDLGFPCALIDGEKFSWYGLRSLTFLQALSQQGS